MKYLILAAILALSFDVSQYGPVSETVYTLTTDCNGYSPLSINFYSLECDL